MESLDYVADFGRMLDVIELIHGAGQRRRMR
jgi:hypothetical protein